MREVNLKKREMCKSANISYFTYKSKSTADNASFCIFLNSCPINIIILNRLKCKFMNISY